jgi:uncharacterized protein (TIGR02246 family)
MKVGHLARLSLGVALAALSLAAPAGEASVAPAWAREFLRDWYASYNAGDATHVAGLFTVDATLGTDRGRTAIVAALNRAFVETEFGCTGHFESFRQIEDLAVGWGVDVCTETHKTDRRSKRTKERWLIVLERQGDGRWLISRETWEDLKP